MYKDLYNEWLKSPKLSEKEREELKGVKDEKDIEYRFGKDLDFGTAGMRGILGQGTNMMNVHTVKQATQGLAEYIKSLGAEAKERGVAISYDTRRFSAEFARATAEVLKNNGVNVFLFDDVHPVPMLSFAVRELNAIAGVMITASHNPKEYNGYKVYGEDGAQMSPEATEVVVKYIREIGSPISDKIVEKADKPAKIKLIGKSIDSKYYKRLKNIILSKKAVKKVGKSIKLVYTPVHGSGYIPVTTMLKKIGIKATIVEEQTKKDPDFSTVAVPNPEYKETLAMGINLAKRIKADVVFGTDPDCDRLGVALKNDAGEFEALSGNQVGALLLDYILLRLKEDGNLPENGFVVKSFVSTSLAKLIADDYGVDMIETPVGFKFIGEKIKELDDTGKKTFIFGFEESCGYLRGTHARDKDAVVASVLVAEMVCYYNTKNVSIFSRLNDLYNKYGYVLDKSVAISFSGLNAMKEMTEVVDKMKTMPVEKIGIYEVVATRDYSVPVRKSAAGEEILDISKNNSVYFELKNGSFVCVRPSGTEPKLKVYYSIKARDKDTAENTFTKLSAAFTEMIGQ